MTEVKLMPAVAIRTGAITVDAKALAITFDVRAIALGMAQRVAARNADLLGRGKDPDGQKMPPVGNHTMGYITGALARSITGELVGGDDLDARAIVTGTSARGVAIHRMNEAGHNPLWIGEASKRWREDYMRKAVRKMLGKR